MDGDLQTRANEFASELAATLTGVLPVGKEIELSVEVAEPGDPTRITVSTAPLPLFVDGDAALSLELDFRCEWDHRESYLAVNQSKIAVATADTDAPLFRYDFVGNAHSTPCAHLQIHAHRDEIVYHMVRGERHRSRRRSKRVDAPPGGKYHRVADLHFPLGGRRMRPCVEDVLQFLIEEFAVDTNKRWRDVIEAGRARWRRRQVGATVRDAPATAAGVLEELGYTVRPPKSGHVSDRVDRLTER